MLIRAYEERGAIQRWPSLAITAACFLSLLLQHDPLVPSALQHLSSRLIRAKNILGVGGLDTSSSADVHRRVYDVVAVLSSCGLLQTPVPEDTIKKRMNSTLDKIWPRKHVRVNFEVFQQICQQPTSSTIFSKPAGSCGVLSSSLDRDTGLGSVSGDIAALECQSGSKTNSDDIPKLPDIDCANQTFRQSTGGEPVDGGCTIVKPGYPTQKFDTDHQLVNRDWWDDTLNSMALTEVLPVEEQVALEVQERFENDWNEPWGPNSLAYQVQLDFLRSDMGLAHDGSSSMEDLECREVLNHELAETTTDRYFVWSV